MKIESLADPLTPLPLSPKGGEGRVIVLVARTCASKTESHEFGFPPPLLDDRIAELSENFFSASFWGERAKTQIKTLPSPLWGRGAGGEGVNVQQKWKRTKQARSVPFDLLPAARTKLTARENCGEALPKLRIVPGRCSATFGRKDFSFAASSQWVATS
jgi:hypothetical protein